jgi:hypothetical protein
MLRDRKKEGNNEETKKKKERIKVRKHMYVYAGIYFYQETSQSSFGASKL